jgi:hypothetical protein
MIRNGPGNYSGSTEIMYPRSLNPLNNGIKLDNHEG